MYEQLFELTIYVGLSRKRKSAFYAAVSVRAPACVLGSLTLCPPLGPSIGSTHGTAGGTRGQ